jgi:hypothetical protein
LRIIWLFRKDLILKTNLGVAEIYSRLVKIIGNEDPTDPFQKKYVGKIS